MGIRHDLFLETTIGLCLLHPLGTYHASLDCVLLIIFSFNVLDNIGKLRFQPECIDF